RYPAAVGTLRLMRTDLTGPDRRSWGGRAIASPVTLRPPPHFPDTVTPHRARATRRRQYDGPRSPPESRNRARPAGESRESPGSAAVAERAVDVDAKLARAPDRRRHGDRRQRFRLERQPGAAPDVAIGIRVDHGLQRLAERAEGIRALLDGLAAEHLAAQFQSLVVQVARVHPFLHFPERTSEDCHCRG